MQVTSGSTSMPMASTENSQKPPRSDGPPPPPKGGVPPGLDSAVASLSDDQQQSTADMLASLTNEQQESLKSRLDEVKPLTEGLSDEDIGSIFFEALSSIYSGADPETSSNNSTAANVDLYA